MGKVSLLKGFGIGVGLAASVFLALVISSPSALAADDMSVNSRLEYGDAKTYCGDNFAKGMVWLSNDSGNYYSESVKVGADAASVTVQVRGAVNTCKTVMDPRRETQAYADNVDSRTEPTLTITGTRFYRGSVPSGTTNAWSTKGSYLEAKLDVKDVAMCTGVKGTITDTVDVKIYRNLLWKKIAYDGSVTWTEGGDGIEDISVKIQRSCPDVIRPKVNILGADLFVQGKITTSRSTVNDKTYGSWGEYGVIAGGSISGMASGSGYAIGTNSTNICSVSLLTFSNTRSGGCSSATLGGYERRSPSPLATTVQRFQQNPNKGTISGKVSLDTLAGGKVYYATNNITLTATSPLPKGKWVVIMADARHVRIDSDIHYSGSTLTASSQIPQVVIIGQNITIDDSVTNIDAWLLAIGSTPHGVIKTCDASGVNEPAQLTRFICNKKLTVNGPVMARTLQLYRTAGDVKTPGVAQAAETFNFRPDAYLWMLRQGQTGGRVTTVSTIELPPRF